jgi:thiamine biosynthesis lipoprotein
MGIATSGVTKRKGLNHNKSWHHIIDPRSGMPSDTDLLTVTITASNTIQADVYAKCLVILGTKDAKQFIEKYCIQSAYLQLRDGKTINYEIKKKAKV